MSKDLQLKDLSYYLSCNGIKIHWEDTGEEWQARVYDFTRYADMYVISITANNNNVLINIKSLICENEF